MYSECWKLRFIQAPKGVRVAAWFARDILNLQNLNETQILRLAIQLHLDLRFSSWCHLKNLISPCVSLITSPDNDGGLHWYATSAP